MLKLSVHLFYSHLPLEHQGPLLVSQEAFLSFLRAEFHRNEATKRVLVEAGRAHARREYVPVTDDFDERHAAKAVIYAYLRIAAELKRRGKVKPRPSQFKVYQRKPQLRPAKKSAKPASLLILSAYFAASHESVWVALCTVQVYVEVLLDNLSVGYVG